MKTQTTPRPYLSYSQLILLETNRGKYIERYCYGREFPPTKAMELGSRVADALETEEPTDLDHLKMFLPEFQHHEYEIRDVELSGVPLMGKLDGFEEMPLGIDEVKTGTKWTQAMVDKHDQFDFYTALVWLKFGKLPERFTLHWLPTMYDPVEEDYVLTGEVRMFQTKRTMADVMRMIPRVVRAWKEIKKLYKEFNQQTARPTK